MAALLGRWTRLHTARRCGSCETLIAGGEPVYLTKMNAPRCVGCARKHIGAEPPPDLAPLAPVQTPVLNTQPVLEFARFDKSFAERARRFFGSRLDVDHAGDRE